MASPSQSGCFLEDFPTTAFNPFIPLFVEKCINFIDCEGVSTEGTYRIPGNRAQGQLFTSKFQEDPNVDILSLDIPVNAVATVLKSFFNDLSEPLVPRALHAELKEAAGMPDKSSCLLMLRGVIKKLLEQNYEVLKYLISHLYRVSQHQEEKQHGRQESVSLLVAHHHEHRVRILRVPATVVPPCPKRFSALSSTSVTSSSSGAMRCDRIPRQLDFLFVCYCQPHNPLFFLSQ